MFLVELIMKRKNIFIFIALFALVGCQHMANEPSWPAVTDGSTQVTPYATSPFGERTPVDQYGGNISSSAPPMYPEQMTVYEEYDQTSDITNESFSGSNYTQDNQSAPETSEIEDVNEPVEDWLVKEGISLKNTIEDWSDRAGWKLVWKTGRNYQVQAGAMFRGRYVDVVSALVRSFARARPAPYATFYKGNRVLVVDTKEGENAY